MDLNATLMWLVGFSTLGMVINLRHIPWRHAWPIVLGVVLVISSFMVFLPLAFPVAGYLILLVWILALALPVHLSNRLFLMLTLQRYEAARRLLSWLRLLQPTQHHRCQYRLYDAYHRASQSHDEAPLQALINEPGNMGVLAQLLVFRLRGDWEGALHWMIQPEQMRNYSGNILFIQHHFRALAETAGPQAAFERMQLLEAELLERGLYLQRTMLRAEVLSYFGYRDALEALLETSLKKLPWSYATFLRGNCNWAQGNFSAARDAVQQLEHAAADPTYQATLSKKITCGHLLGRVLPSPQTSFALKKLTENAAHLATDPWGWRHSGDRCWVAYGLILANVAFYLVAEWYGGSTDPEVLMQLGSLWPEAVANGAYWRILTANFLHLGALHLLLNMYFLFFLAGFLEPRLGRLPFFAIYILSGLIAGAISSVWYYITDPYVQSVGASGSVLGLLGAFAAVRLQAWMQHRAIGARRQLTVVVILLSLQVFYDLITPISNGMVHLLGAITGFALTFLWLAFEKTYLEVG